MLYGVHAHAYHMQVVIPEKANTIINVVTEHPWQRAMFVEAMQLQIWSACKHQAVMVDTYV